MSTQCITSLIVMSFLLATTLANTAQSGIFNKINYAPNDRTQIAISIEQDKVVALNLKTQNQVTLQNIDGIPDYARDLWLEDFNFDGIQDIAITTSANKNGLSQAYTIFTWDAISKKFTPLPFASILSNIERLSDKKLLRSSYQSKDFWCEDSYRFNQQHKPYLYSRSELLAINVWYTEIYNKKQHIIKRFISTNGRGNYPKQSVFAETLMDQTPLYNAPLPSTMNNTVLRLGAKVQLLDFKKNQAGLHWLYIRTYSRNPIEGWTPLMNINLE